MQFLLRRDGNNYTFWTDAGSGFVNVSSVATVTTGAWQHVAGTWDGTTMNIYVNGVLSGSSARAGANLRSLSNPIWIGGNTISENFTGDIDEVRIWNRTLCVSEIQNNMNGEIATTASGLIANYHFNQGFAYDPNPTVSTLTDVSGSASTGTLTNFALTGLTSNWTAPGAVSSGSNAAVFSPFSITTVLTNVGCNGGSNGAINNTIGIGNSPYTFNWGGGIVTEDRTGLIAGTYNYTVTDANICSVTKTFTITQPSALTSIASQTNITCNGGSNGKASVSVSGGTGGYTYSWAPSGGTATTATGLATGNYTCTMTDANSCTKTQTVNITQPSAIVTTSAVTNVLCNGGTGSATVTATGGTTPYTYVASNGGTSSSQSGLVPAAYTYTITDANSCTKTQALTITQPSAIATTSAVANVLCNGGTGSATVTATGGTTPYTYVASNGATVPIQSGLAPGAYTYTITDANGCAKTQALTIIQPSAIVTTSAVTNALCGGAGSATVTATGGTAPYTYVASNGATVPVQSGLAPGVYTYTVIDANTCTKTQVLTIANLGSIVTTSAVTNVLCNGGTGSATVTATGGTAPYTYVASNGGTSSSQSGLTPGVYTYTITDAAACSKTQVLTITEPSAISLLVSVSNPTICAGASSTLTANATGGTGAITYAWVSGPTGSVNTINPTSTAVYTVGVTDANNCIASSTVGIIVNALPNVNAISNNTLLCAGQTATLTASGAANYMWNTTATTSAIAVSPTATTSYTVNGTDANGCSNTTTITQNVSTCTSISQITNLNSQILIYPNPSTGLFTITTDEVISIEVTNILGETILKTNISEGNYSLNLSEQPNGIYFINVTKNGTHSVYKLIKH
jgi:hypothetical protein